MEKAINDAEHKQITLPAADYVEALGQEIIKLQTERQKIDPTASRYPNKFKKKFLNKCFFKPRWLDSG